MLLSRRSLLAVVAAGTTVPAAMAAADSRKAERSLGSASARTTVTECFSLTCPHCADFTLNTLPELKAKWIAPGRVRWVFFDFPGDLLALQAAQVARYQPPERYETFIDALFANQALWVFGPDAGQGQGLWRMAAQAGMARSTFEQASADTDLRDWILQQSKDAQTRWNVDATPSFLVDGKVYTGDMSPAEFGTILAN